VAEGSRHDSVAAVVVDYGHEATIGATLASLRESRVRPLQTIVVANHPAGRAQPVVAAADPEALVLEPTRNGGFAGGCNLGAAAAHPDVAWLLFLNPDATLEPDALGELLGVARAQPGTGAVGAQVLLPDGRTNAGDNQVHPSGLVWAGRLYEPAEDGPDRSVLALSGAALLVRRAVFEALGGLCERYFTYHEDVELCWRVRLAGWDVRFCPRARVRHAYDFHNKPDKWRHMERNRAWLVLSAYERRTLLALAPLLAATELGVAASSVAGGWWREKLAAYRDVLAARRWLAGRRAEVQRLRTRDDGAVLDLLAPRVTSPLLDGPAVRLANPLLEGYVRLARATLLRGATTGDGRATAEARRRAR
jgi:GT2 family glycosyltransferase